MEMDRIQPHHSTAVNILLTVTFKRIELDQRFDMHGWNSGKLRLQFFGNPLQAYLSETLIQ